MKKILMYAAMLFATMPLLFLSCKDRTGTDLETEYDENKKVAEMTPEEQKDFLVNVGKEFVNIFNPDDQRGAAELAEGLYNKYESWDWEVMGEQVEDEFRKIDAQGFFRMPRHIAALAVGEATVADTKEFLISFAVAGRLFEFDEATKTMKVSKTNDGTIIARFNDANGVACELKVWGEGKNTSVSYTYDDYEWESGYYDEFGNWIDGKEVYNGTRVIRAEVPAEVHMYLKQCSTKLMTLDFTWDSNFKDYVNHTLAINVTNLKWTQEIKASTTNATAAFSLLYDDAKLLVAAVNLPKYQLNGWEGGKDITPEEGESWINRYDDQYRTMLGALGAGEGAVDIIGKVRGKIAVNNGAAFYDAMEAWDNTDYPTSLEEATAYCKVYNDYVHAGLYYGGQTEQANLKMQPSSRYIDDYGNDVYGSVPVLYFPKDGTTYEIVTFFESTKFNVLIDLVEELVNTYKDLDTGHLIFDEGRIELN